MSGAIRKGKVSSINYETGMMRVTYKDRDNAVTAEMPILNNNMEYSMPGIGQDVLVAHLSNGSSRGVVLGPLWNQENMPAEARKDFYRKDFSSRKGVAYIEYDDKTGQYRIKAANLILDGVNKTELQGPHLLIAANIDILVETAELQLQVESVKVANDMDINGAGVAVNAVMAGFRLETEEAVTLESGENLGLISASDVSIQAAGSLQLKDAEYETTLKEIMDRLKALDGGG